MVENKLDIDLSWSISTSSFTALCSTSSFLFTTLYCEFVESFCAIIIHICNKSNFDNLHFSNPYTIGCLDCSPFPAFLHEDLDEVVVLEATLHLELFVSGYTLNTEFSIFNHYCKGFLEHRQWNGSGGGWSGENRGIAAKRC